MISTTMATDIRKNKIKNILQNTAAVLLALCVWQGVAMAVGEEILLASPLKVLIRFFELLGEKFFWTALGYTFLKITAGFFFGFTAGCILAVIAGRFKICEIIFRPFLITVKTVPVASFIVISLIWLSSKDLSVFISFLMVLPIIYTNVLEGLKNTDKKLLEAASIYKMPWSKRFKYIHLPALRPHIISACSLALGLAWKSGIAAEIIGIPEGSVGEMFYYAKAYLNSLDLFAWTLTVVAVSVVFEKAFTMLIKLFYKRLFKPSIERR